MKPTSKRLLFLIGVVGALSAVSVSRLALATSGTLIAVRPATPIAMAVMCGALTWWTVLVRRRLLHIQRAKHEAQASPGAQTTPFIMRDKPLNPLVAARTVALAFAVSRAGAWVCGWYAGVALSFLGHLGSADVRWRLAYAVTTTVLAAILVVVAVWLERSCKLPPPRPNAEASPA